MVGRPEYIATAECVSTSKGVKITNENLSKIFEKDAATGMTFFKRLAGAVIQRLLYNYESFLSEGSLKKVTPSYG